MFFDTHAHYDDSRFDEDRHELLAALPEKGVSLVLNAASNMPSSEISLKMAQEYSYVYASAGVHPHDAKDITSADLDRIAELYKEPKVVAIGEIGLDYHYDFSPRDIQKYWFEKQLELAFKLSAPVIIHDRDAHQQCLEMIKQFKGLRGVFHCFTGSLEMSKELLKLGFYISFGGSSTFPSNKKSADIILNMPKDRILIETDSPYLTPHPFRGKRNDSSYVRLVAEKIAEVRGESVETVAQYTMENGKTLFGIK